MRILHVSDLHFGAHDENLMSNLLARAAEIQPNVIVCTGDLADNPQKRLMLEAFDFLSQLQKHSVPRASANGSPPLVIVPGNHDYRVGGWLWRKGWLFKPADLANTHVLDARAPEIYLPPPANVWIFGFDSARKGSLGGSGWISDEDVKRFHERYEALSGDPEQGENFKKAFKIVAVHHHPFPVNWRYNEKDRWLTMVNAGRFLSAILVRQIHLVLHGHEHHQAHARVSSSLGDNDHEAAIVSLGATLRKAQGPEQKNWFGVVHVDHHSVDVKFYASVDGLFKPAQETQNLCVRSRSESAELQFEQSAAKSGYLCRALAAVAIIDKDGDARRSVECEDVTITDDNYDVAALERLRLPWTSGYVYGLRAEGKGIGVSLTSRIPPGSRNHDFETKVDFGRRLAVPDQVSYDYHWHAVNAFAMNQREFDIKYPSFRGRENIEFTHYTVSDPIEALTVVVKFPDGFRPPDLPRVRVMDFSPGKGVDEWPRNHEAERLAGSRHALRYFDSLNIAALRVDKPRPGLSYGIEWRLPPAPARIKDEYTAKIDAFRQIWLKAKPTEPQGAKLSELLVRLVIGARGLLMKDWSGDVEASLMFPDKDYNLRFLSAVVDEAGSAHPVRYDDFVLDFGDGVAGRAFKTNQLRIYAYWDEESDEPQYYRPFDAGPPHRVLISFPVQAPVAAVRDPYCVFSLGSTRADCPLLEGGPAGPRREEFLAAFQSGLNEYLYSAFDELFLRNHMTIDMAPRKT